MSSPSADPAIEANSSSNSTNPSTVTTESLFYSLFLDPAFIAGQAQVLFSALSIIWLGAHASLRRPPSAAPAKTRGKRQPKEDKFTEGLVASDAIMFPLVAGVMLIGLYYLIDWLQDPDILNKFIRGYMSIFSIVSLGGLCGDALTILTSLVFPSVWADGSGRLYRIDPARRCQVLVNGEEETPVEGKEAPFPGFFARLPLSEGSKLLAWEIRNLFTEEWTVRLAVHGLVNVKFDIRFNQIIGFPVAVLVAIAYNRTQWYIWANLLGSAFSYAAFALMSPTSFGIGTIVLAGFFVYDIIMVFYTPFMIKVATAIDAPIKLVFKGSKAASMLGLGDIVVPGLLMSLALRYDLYQFYKKQIKLEPVQLESDVASGPSGDVVTVTETKHRRVKQPYVDSLGQWGNRFWTTKLGNLLPVPAAASTHAATAFPKPYFYASVVGYGVGMVLTLAALLVFKHGQPALLYLVPCVTGSIWLTALLRGEMKEVWAYTEDGSLDTEDVVVEVDADGNVIKEVAKDKAKDVGLSSKEADKGESKSASDENKSKNDAKEPKHYDVLSFSITAPRPCTLDRS